MSKSITARERACDLIKGLVSEDRNKEYGEPQENWGRICDFWDIYWRGRQPGTLELHDHAVMMILVKVSRLMNSPHNGDTWLDIGGYAVNGYEVTREDKPPAK